MHRMRIAAAALLLGLTGLALMTAVTFLYLVADRYLFPNEIPGPGFFGILYPETVTPKR